MENNTNNKFVQVRFESNKSEKSLGMILHNTRKIKPGYLRKNEDHNKESNTFFIFNNKNEIEEYNITDKKTQTIVNNKLKQQLQDTINLEKSNNKNFREKKHAIYQDSVITLSNSINTMYSNNKIDKKELNKLFLESVKKLEKELNIKAQYISIHYDEKTPHAHIAYKNYYNNKSITNTLKKQYSKAQDLVGEVWQQIGFTRGISKNTTKSKHLTVHQMHQKEKEIEFNTLNNKLKKDTLNIVNNSTTKNLMGEKIERKPLLNNIYNTLKSYSNYNLIAKTETNTDTLKEQLKYKDKEIKNLTNNNNLLNDKLNNLLAEKENTNKLFETVKNETKNLIDKIKAQSKQITNYEKVLKDNNIDINQKNTKKSKEKNHSIDF